MSRRADLDGVRGFACLSVLTLHIVIGPITFQPGTIYDAARLALQPFMVGGVDLFFVLSGFLISGILMDEKAKGKTARQYFFRFWRHRFARIFPVYYLMIGLLLALYTINGLYSSAYTRALLFDQMPIWTYATFTQNFYMIFNGVYGNFLGVTWSLAMEEQFYLLLPLAVFFLSRGDIAKVAVAMILLAPVVRAILWELHSWQASYHLSPARMDTIMWGVLIAYIIRRPDFVAALSRRIRWIDGFIVVSIALIAGNVFYYASAPVISQPSTHALGLFISTLRYSLLATVYALVILRLYLPGANWVKAFFSNRRLGRVGLESYGAYMYHQFFNLTVHFWLNGRASAVISDWRQWYLPSLVFALTFGAAALSYRYMEAPIMSWARNEKKPIAPNDPAVARSQSATI